MKPTTTVAFFDLGNTLLVKNPDGGDGRLIWAPGSKEALASLSETPHRLGVLSNTGDASREELLKVDLPEDFDFGTFEDGLVILSSEVKVEKPDPTIYAIAIERAGLPAGQLLYVSESIDELKAAEAAGLQSHQVDKFPDDLDALVSKLGGSPVAGDNTQ